MIAHDIRTKNAQIYSVHPMSHLASVLMQRSVAARAPHHCPRCNARLENGVELIDRRMGGLSCTRCAE